MPEGCFTGPCKRCRLHRQHWVHDYTYNCWTDPEHPELESHSFEPTLLDAMDSLNSVHAQDGKSELR